MQDDAEYNRKVEWQKNGVKFDECKETKSQVYFIFQKDMLLLMLMDNSKTIVWNMKNRSKAQSVQKDNLSVEGVIR